MRALASVLAVLLMLLTGCFGGDDGDPDPDPNPDQNSTDPPPAPTPTPPAPRQEPLTWHISIAGNDFVEGSLTIQVGDKVVWTHEDGAIPHSVTAGGGTFDSGACPGNTCMSEFANSEFSFTFTEAGEFPYHCRVHGSMTDTITVLQV